jgi:hypothetical protein
MESAKHCIVLILILALVAQGQGNSFNKVRYNGGSVDSKVSPHDWDNHLTVTSDMITLALKDGKKVDIPPKSVTSLSYGQEAHRRVGTMIALAVLVTPIALFGLFHKTRLHFIGIQYTTPDGKSAGILLQGDKDNYRAMLVALQGVSGVAVTVGEKEREFVPVGVKTEVTKEPHEGKPAGNEKTADEKQKEGTPAGCQSVFEPDRSRCAPRRRICWELPGRAEPLCWQARRDREIGRLQGLVPGDCCPTWVTGATDRKSGETELGETGVGHSLA